MTAKRWPAGRRRERPGWWRAMALALLLALLGAGRPAARAQEPGTLRPFEPVRGVLNASQPSADWTFEGRAGEIVSLIAQSVEGDLDPVIQVIGPAGEPVAENDDLDSLMRDAGLEALTLPADGTYTVRVLRYQGAAGTTSGTYELALTPGFAAVALRSSFDQGDVSWVTAAGEPLVLAQERLRLRVTAPGETLLAVPPGELLVSDLYTEAEARVSGAPPYAEFGLVFRAQGPGPTRFYRLAVNTAGQWRVLYEDATGVYALRSWAAADALASRADPWVLAVMARGSRLDFFANGALLGTLTDERLPAPGTVGVFVTSGEDAGEGVTVLFDNVTVTTRLGSTYRGLPLALTTWNAPDPATIIAELAGGGHIAPAAERDLYVLERSLSVTGVTARFEPIGTEVAQYDDFVLGGRVAISTVGESVGCGLFFRWQDERNLALAYVDSGGGFGLVQASDAQLATNVYDLSPLVAPRGTKLLVIAQGKRVALYVNGALVAQETMLPGAGRVGVALLNYEDVRTDCLWSEMWVWPLLE
ncbi:MAG: hypothetical protein KJ047_05880 [Anaerolineae bacterium]|nr:hypothetical protein [Anaerolineae bacterium]